MKTKTKPNISSNLVWAFGERILAQLVTLLVTIILARLLGPEEYAIIAVVMIFIEIANVLVTSGYGVALIQKKDADELDFSTTLSFSLTLSFALYIVLFLLSPSIAAIYNMPLLVPVIRVMAIRVILASVNTVQQAIISKQMAFKKFFFATFLGTAVSALLGIILAYKGYGVWALVIQYLSNAAIDTVMLSFTSGWRVSLRFSLIRMKRLFPFGSKVLLSDLTSNVYSKIRNFLMSTHYLPVDLSFYNQADKYSSIFINNIEVSMNKVLFQVTSDCQNSRDQIKELTRKTLKYCMFILTPLQMGIAASAGSWVPLILTEKWLPCVPHLQILCVTYLLNPLVEAHTRNIKALGLGDLLLKIMTVRYSIGILIVILSVVLFDNPLILTASALITKLFAVFFCGYVDKKEIGYRFSEQLADTVYTLLAGIAMALFVSLIGKLIASPLCCLSFQIFGGIIAYILISALINKELVITVAKKIKGAINRFLR